MQRANYVYRLWKLSCSAMVMIPSPILHGWTKNMDVMYVNMPFPKYVIPLLCDENEHESDDSEDQELL